MKVTLLILALWILLVVGIYVFGIWHPEICVPAANSTSRDMEAMNAEKMPWFKRFPEVYEERNLDSLQLVHTIMRHGDRTNLEECQYPNDPYLNATYEPYGFGGMTNLGKRRMYETGRSLRHMYGRFLQNYKASHVDAIASALQRAQDSLALLLAGLYPPEDDQVWLDGFNWQPISFRTQNGKDNLLGNPRKNCKNWSTYYGASHAQFSDIIGNYSEYFAWLENFTGWKQDLLSVNLIYNSITTNLAWGYDLDDNLKAYWPEPTLTLNAIFWQAWSETEDTRRACAGKLIQKIIDDTLSKANELDNEKKLHVYSSSDFNLISLLRIFNQEIFDNPDYGSHVIVELHKDETQDHYLRFFYRTSLSVPVKELFLDDCHLHSEEKEQSVCRLDTFVKTRSKYFLSEGFC